MAAPPKEAKLWGEDERFTESISFDKALYKHDIMGSRAHASMLAKQLDRDAGRLLDCRVRLNFRPLGACALAGTGLPIDRFLRAYGKKVLETEQLTYMRDMSNT